MKSKIMYTVLSIAMLMILSTTVFAKGPEDKDKNRGDRSAGAVYTMTNAPGGNEVVIFDRDHDGSRQKRVPYRRAGRVSAAGWTH